MSLWTRLCTVSLFEARIDAKLGARMHFEGVGATAPRNNGSAGQGGRATAATIRHDLAPMVPGCYAADREAHP